MRLKGTPEGAIHDLRKDVSVEWLGFEIGKGKQELKVEIADKAWSRLGEYLALAHETPDAPLRAAATINGWIDQMGPCYPFVMRPQVCEDLRALAAKQAFDEIPTRDAILSRWRRAHQRWCDVRNEVKEHPEALDSIWYRRAGNDSPARSLRAGAPGEEPNSSGLKRNGVPSEGYDKAIAPF
jgi:hypothetical protein